MQLRTVSELFLALAEPAVLMGDMNSTADDPQIIALKNGEGVVDAVGMHDSSASAGRIDWIFTRGLHSVDAGVEDHGASDHPLVWAELEVPVGVAGR